MNVGLIGVGQMGRPMATRLAAAGFTVTAYDSRPQALESLAGTVRPAGSPADVATAADVTILMILDADQAEEAIWGDRGFAAGQARGWRLVMMSSLPPSFAAATARRAAEAGFDVLDAPVSGGVEGATAGTLTIMASGQAAAFAVCEPVLAAVGGSVVHVGEQVGLGCTLKALNQAMYFAGMAVAAEAVVAGAKAGLDPDTLVRVISGGSGDNWALRHRVPLAWRNDYLSGGSLAIALKDLRTAAELGQELRVTMPVTQATLQLVRTAQVLCDPGGDGDDPLIVAAVEQLAGHRVEAVAPH